MYLVIIKKEKSVLTFETLADICDYLIKIGYQYKEIIVISLYSQIVVFWGIANDLIITCEEAKKELEEWRKEIENEKH